MKKAFVLSILVLTCFAAFCQDDRDSIILPVVGQRMGYLAEATGWMKNSIGQWVSRPNKIANDYVGENTKLIDFQKTGLGIDNFNSFEINNLTYKGQQYILFTKQAKSGYYKYPQVKESWTYREKVFFFVFNPGDLQAVDSLKNDSLNQFTIRAQYNYSYESNINDEVTFANFIKKSMDGKSIDPGCELYILVKPITEKQVVRFMISNRPIGVEYGLGKDGIKTRYYETSIDNFKKLFPATVIF